MISPSDKVNKRKPSFEFPWKCLGCKLKGHFLWPTFKIIIAKNDQGQSIREI